MPLFFIEMGQGIIARPDLRVCTSALYSCTLITGHNAGSGYGGAYHYPSDRLQEADVREDMDNWAAVLRPTAVTLIFARDSSGAGLMGTVHADKVALRQWVQNQCGVMPAEREAVAAGMEFLAGGFNADSVSQLAGDFSRDNAIEVHALSAGTYPDHGRFSLIGRNREGG